MTGDRVVCCLHGVGNLRKCSENDQRSRAKYSYLIMFWYNNIILTKINSDQIMGRAQSTNIHILATSSVYDDNININTRTKRKVVSTVQRIPRSIRVFCQSEAERGIGWLRCWPSGQGGDRGPVEMRKLRYRGFLALTLWCRPANGKIPRFAAILKIFSRSRGDVTK